MSYIIEGRLADGSVLRRGEFTTTEEAEAYKKFWRRTMPALRRAEVLPAPTLRPDEPAPPLIEPWLRLDLETGRLTAGFNGETYQLLPSSRSEGNGAYLDIVKGDGQVYTVSASGCDCADATYRQRLCKHCQYRERLRQMIRDLAAAL